MFARKEWVTSIQDAERSPKNVKHLQLLNTDLNQLAGRFAQFVNLQSLDVRWSKSAELPSDIYSLRSLRFLSILNMPLKYFPSEICSLSELLELTVRGTEITVVPKEISQLGRLRKIELGNSNISSIPLEFSRLRNLRELNAPENLLTTIPDELATIPHLKSLGMIGNQFSEQEKRRLRELYNRRTMLSRRTIFC